MSENLSKKELYDIYSKNINYANLQLEILRKQAREIAAKYYWYKEKKQNKFHDELIAITNLFSYILGNKFELQLMKIIHENSAAAFKDEELEDIKSADTMYEKWVKCLEICFNKNIDNTVFLGKDIKELFVDEEGYMKVIQDIITMRNRLAHGQWNIQLNSNNTKIVNLEILGNYPDISKLVLLRKKLDVLVKIVETIVVYKDKRETKYTQKMECLIKKINNYDKRINKIELKKYINLEYQKIKQKHNKNKLK